MIEGECVSCGAPFRPHDAACSYCLRSRPARVRASSAEAGFWVGEGRPVPVTRELIDVTTLNDPVRRYIPI